MSPLEAIVEGAHRLANKTKQTYRRVARDFVAFAGDEPTNWTPAACDAWVAQLDVAPRSINIYIAAIRWVPRRWAALNVGACDGARDFAAAIENVCVPAETLPAAPTPLGRDEVEVLLASCGRDDDPTDLRDRALLAITFALGLGRAELADIEFDDLDHGQRTIVISARRAKRNKRHVVRVSPACWARLDAWLAWLRRRHVALTGGVFRALRRSLDAELGWEVEAAMSAESVYRVVRRRAQRAGIPGRVSGLTLRYTLVTTLRACGVPEHEIAQRVGHAVIATMATHSRGRAIAATDGLPT